MKDYYAARAPEYERIFAKPERQSDLRHLEILLPKMFAGCRLLDVACGTAYWTTFLVHETKSIVGIDANAETLEVAADKSWPPGRVEFRVADAYDLPEDLGTFDAAFAGFWWSHIPVRDRARFLRSLDRRLTPGAKVVFLDNLYVEGNSTPIDHRDDDGNTYQRRRLDDGSMHRVVKNFPLETEIRDDIAAFGTNMQFTAFQYYWLFAYEKRRVA